MLENKIGKQVRVLIGEKMTLNEIKQNGNQMVFAGNKESGWNYFIKEQSEGEYILEYKVGKPDTIMFDEEVVMFSNKVCIQSTIKPRQSDYETYKSLLKNEGLWEEKI